ncbi:MAG: hypothetical protein HC945_03010 [Nitrosarchaeum sp.]|nr:hypothetical protein [Nitrosarchaeum sp.]
MPIAKRKQRKTDVQDSENLEFDLSALKNTYANFKRWAIANPAIISYLLLFLLIAIPFLTSVHVRSYPASLPITEEWAKNSILSNVRNQITAQIEQQYPNLPADRKQARIQEDLDAFYQQNKAAIDEQAIVGGQQFRELMQDDTGQTYLLAIDPYEFLRRAESIAETGDVCDEIRDGQCWDTHKLAPLGVPASKDFHSSFGAWLYKVVSVFNKDVTVKNVFFYIPLIVASLATIPAFFLGRRAGGTIAGFTAAMLVALNASFLGRTPAGFSDTDAYNVFFPLLIFAFLAEAMHARETWKRVTFSLLAAASTALFTQAWGGWFLTFLTCLAILIGFITYQLLKAAFKLTEKKSPAFKDLPEVATAKRELGVAALFIGMSFILLMLLGISPLTPFKNAIGSLSINEASNPTLWPNVLTTVAELNDASITDIIQSLGGKFLFFLALFAIPLSLVKYPLNLKSAIILCFGAIVSFVLVTAGTSWSITTYLVILFLFAFLCLMAKIGDDTKGTAIYTIFITIWIIFTMYPSTQGVRFIFLMLPAFAVAVGITIGRATELLGTYGTAVLDLPRWASHGFMWILLLMLLLSPVRIGADPSTLQAARQISQNQVPSVNDAWVETLHKIRDNSEQDAIVNSWWDFGHWFKYYADRAVTFDGGSQNTPMAHWIGRALITGDEAEAIGILRMLDCGSNRAFEILRNETNNSLESIELLYQIIPIQDRTQAQQVLLAEGITPGTAQRTLDNTHCAPPENYFITSEDMVGKAGVWGHFGTWNFERSSIYNQMRNLSREESITLLQESLNITRVQAQSTYSQITSSDQAANAWISPWPGYITSNWRACQAQNTTIICPLGLSVGQTQGGQAIIRTLRVDPAQPENASIEIIIQAPNGRISEVQQGTLSFLALAQEGSYTTHPFTAANVGFGGLLDTQSTPPRVLLGDPEHMDSMFAHLFYLEGRYLEHFDLFHDTRAINGWRILTWKVDWDGK